MPRLAKSLAVLRSQIDALAPGRDKSSDGTFPSAEHLRQNPHSDHNTGHALDITNDPAHGVVAADLAEQLRQSKDLRIKYIISNRRIASPTSWKWRSYNGPNPHDKHFHVSVVDDVRADDTKPWKITLSKPTDEVSVIRPRLEKGSRGPAVIEAQNMLGIAADGVFGKVMLSAVLAFQTSHGLVADGVIGPYTWDKLRASPKLTHLPVRHSNIVATVFSSSEDGHAGAYGEIVGNKTRGVALPYRFPSVRPKIMLSYNGKIARNVRIVSVGPWNIHDVDYVMGEARPRVESGGKDDFGRKPKNRAGIDLSPALARELGIDGLGTLDWWEFE